MNMKLSLHKVKGITNSWSLLATELLILTVVFNKVIYAVFHTASERLKVSGRNPKEQLNGIHTALRSHLPNKKRLQ